MFLNGSSYLPLGECICDEATTKGIQDSFKGCEQMHEAVFVDGPFVEHATLLMHCNICK